MSIAGLRTDYTLGELLEEDLDRDPIQQFKKWFKQAQEAVPEPNAMTLATADRAGRPSARIVLLKGVDERGFTFFTNYESRKGRELAENAHAAMVFFWAQLERQICITGQVSRLGSDEAEAYFRSRPRGNRLAAWVSKQSQVIANRAELEDRMKEFEALYPDDHIPKPPYWGGYLLAPAQIEFWQGRTSRLHDRLRYSKQPDNQWRVDRLSP